MTVDPAVALAILALLLGAGGPVAIIIQLWGKKVRTPADDNEASQLAKEWYRDMLADAKAEREELRKTIDELRDENKENTVSINRLEAMLERKDGRIKELEDRRDSNVAKLQAGLVLTLGDILGSDASFLPDEVENTRIP